MEKSLIEFLIEQFLAFEEILVTLKYYRELGKLFTEPSKTSLNKNH